MYEVPYKLCILLTDQSSHYNQDDGFHPLITRWSVYIRYISNSQVIFCLTSFFLPALHERDHNAPLLVNGNQEQYDVQYPVNGDTHL